MIGRGGFCKQILGFCLMLALNASITAQAHPYHESLTELEWNAASGYWEMAVRLLPEELETALQRSDGPRINLERSADVDRLILNYLEHHIQFSAVNERQSALGAQGNAVKMVWIGKEVGHKAVWLYLQVRAPGPPVMLRNTLLFDREPDQINRVVHLVAGRRYPLDFLASQGARQQLLALPDGHNIPLP